MRFRITGQGWPLSGGAYLAPVGRVFDFSNPQDRELAQGLIPLNATPLDPEAQHAQQKVYPAHLLGGEDDELRQVKAELTAALRHMNAQDWRGQLGEWFMFLMACKFVGISLKDFTAWSGSDQQEVARLWNSVEPHSGSAFWKALARRGIKLEGRQS